MSTRSGQPRLLVAGLFLASCALSVVSWYTTYEGMRLYLSGWFALLASFGVQVSLVLIAWLIGFSRTEPEFRARAFDHSGHIHCPPDSVAGASLTRCAPCQRSHNGREMALFERSTEAHTEDGNEGVPVLSARALTGAGAIESSAVGKASWRNHSFHRKLVIIVAQYWLA